MTLSISPAQWNLPAIFMGILSKKMISFDKGNIRYSEGFWNQPREILHDEKNRRDEFG